MTQEELKALVEKIQKGTATEEEIELFVSSADEFADEIASLQK